MPLRREKFENNHFYHVIFRGFNQKVLFLEDRDRLRFLLSALLINKVPPNIELKFSRWDNFEMAQILNGEKSPFTGVVQESKPLVSISTFSLLKTHVHFLIKQISSGGIQAFAQRLQNSFAKFLNIKYSQRGPVFEKAFRAVPVIDDRQLRYVVGYITLNVLDTAGIKWRRISLQESWGKVRKVLDSYPWSSYHYFVGKNNFRELIDGDLVKELFPSSRKFKKHLNDWRGDEIVDI